MISHRLQNPAWLSFHIFLPGLPDLFLADYVVQLLDREFQEGRLKRFFFIRYSEGGHQLRLRFLRNRNVGAANLELCLRRSLHEFAQQAAFPESLCRVEPHAYNRSQHYFGETLLSVYSELLNEQTSYLSLRLLRRGFHSRNQLALIASSIIYLVTELAEQPHGLAPSFLSLRAFCATAARRLGFDLQRVTRQQQIRMCGLLSDSISKVSTAVRSDSAVLRIGRLLRRTLRCSPDGRLVATHSLHLLCNKLGLSLADEHLLYRLLYRLTRGR